MVSAAWASEVACIRYAGNDPEILKKFIALKEPGLCDVLLHKPETAAPQDMPARSTGPRKVWWAFWRR